MSCYGSLLELGLSPRSASSYASTIRHAQRWLAARGLDLATVGAEDLLGYLAVRPASWSSRKLIRSALRYYWLLIDRPDPPLLAIRVPPKPRMRCRALTERQAAKLEAAARRRGDRQGLAVLLGLYLGLRRDEIARLRWDEVDDGAGWITVFGKGGVQATLPVHPVLLEELARRPRPASYVFPGARGRAHVTPASVWNWVRDVSTDAGLPPVSTHRLRHTCLATANDATGDLRAVQEFARHARPETTAGYTRVTAKRLLAVMVSLDYQETRA